SRRHPVLVVLHLGGDPDAHWFSFTIIGRPVADGSVWHAHAAARRSTLAVIPSGGIASEHRDTPMRYMVWTWTGARCAGPRQEERKDRDGRAIHRADGRGPAAHRPRRRRDDLRLLRRTGGEEAEQARRRSGHRELRHREGAGAG